MGATACSAVMAGAAAMSGGLPALAGAAHAGSSHDELPCQESSSATVLPAIGGALTRRLPSHPAGAADRLHQDDRTVQEEAGAKLRDLLGLSKEEKADIEQRERLEREKETLILAAQAQHVTGMVALEAANSERDAERRRRQLKKESLVLQIQDDAMAAAEKKIVHERSPDRLDDPNTSQRYGYVSPLASRQGYLSPSHQLMPPQEEEEHGSDVVQPVSVPEVVVQAATDGGTVEQTEVEGRENEDTDVVPLLPSFRKNMRSEAPNVKGQEARGGGGGANALGRRNSLAQFKAAAQKVQQGLRTPGFIMLDRLSKTAGSRVKTREKELWRLMKKHFALIKKQRHAENKASGKMALLKGDLKRRALLSEKLRAAVLAIIAAHEEMGPKVMGELHKAMAAKKTLEASPEFQAVKHLQRVARRAQPLAFHPGLGEARPLGISLPALWAAHIALCRVAKARAASDTAFLARFSVREQVRFLAASFRSRSPSAVPEGAGIFAGEGGGGGGEQVGEAGGVPGIGQSSLAGPQEPGARPAALPSRPQSQLSDRYPPRLSTPPPLPHISKRLHTPLPSSAVDRLKQLYRGGAHVDKLSAGMALDRAVRRSLGNRAWATRVWGGQECGRWLRALQPRRAYASSPALTPQIKSLFPHAKNTTMLANHSAALAQEALSAGEFALSKALLKQVEAQLRMAACRAEKRREVWAVSIVQRRLALYAKRFHTPMAKLRAQITQLLADIDARKAAGATSKHLAVSRNLVEDLRRQMAALQEGSSGVQLLVRSLSRQGSHASAEAMALQHEGDSGDMSFMRSDHHDDCDDTHSGESETESDSEATLSPAEAVTGREAAGGAGWDEEQALGGGGVPVAQAEVGQNLEVVAQPAAAAKEEALMKMLDRQRMGSRAERSEHRSLDIRGSVSSGGSGGVLQRVASVSSTGSAGSKVSTRSKRRRLRLPPLILDWSVEHVVKWLKYVVCLPQYVDVFKAKAVTGDTLIGLHQLKLVAELGVTPGSHPAEISTHVDRALEASLSFAEQHFRSNFFDAFRRQHARAARRVDRRLTRTMSVAMKHRMLKSPRIWALDDDANALGSLVQPHLLLDQASGLRWRNCGAMRPSDGRELTHAPLSEVLKNFQFESEALLSPDEWAGLEITGLSLGHFVKAGAAFFRPMDQDGGVELRGHELRKKEEQRAGHSFQQVGCLCEHNWVCPNCFVWNRGETSYDCLECAWCSHPRPEVYHPPTWQAQGSLGEDAECPVKLLLRKQQEEQGGTSAGVERASYKADVLPAPRMAYPDLTKHPPIVSQRGATEGRRLEEEWQAVEGGAALQDQGETEPDQFEDDNTDIVERSGVPLVQLMVRDDFDWNPVRRFLNKNGTLQGAVEKTQGERDAADAARGVTKKVITAADLRRARIGVVKSMLQ